MSQVGEEKNCPLMNADEYLFCRDIRIGTIEYDVVIIGTWRVVFPPN
jgi:hypothetical protein